MVGLHSKVEKSLQAKDMRYTSNRKVLVSALDQAKGPLTVAQLYDAIKRKVPSSSIYRELRVLVDVQVLSVHHAADRSNRFELAEWLSGHHHHVVCVQCMAISDISLGTEAEHQIAQLGEEAAAEAGYLITAHTLEIEGVCPECPRP